MLLRNFSASLIASATFATVLLSSGVAKAQYALQGTGYWGGTQPCSVQQRVGKGAIDVTEEEKEEKRKLAKQSAQIKLFEKDVEKHKAYLKLISKKLYGYFDDEVADFLLSEHMGRSMQCDEYRTYPEYQCPKTREEIRYDAKNKDPETPQDQAQIGNAPADTSGSPLTKTKKQCDDLQSVPPVLSRKWTTADGGYCQADSKKTGGQVSMNICNDTSLLVDKKSRKMNAAECKAALKEYRSKSLQLENAQADLEEAKQRLEERQRQIADDAERAKIEKEYASTKTEADAGCATGECGSVSSSNKSYMLSAAQIGAGLLFGAIGRKYDERNAEYQVQLGYPPESGSPTAVSFGFPYILAGAYGALTGGSATGSYACGNGINGTGGNGNLWGGGNNVYGPAGALNGGAFGYPQSMYGSPWGGGAFNPGLNAFGNFNGPNGGLPGNLNGQFGVGSPLNGLLGAAGNGNIGTAFNNGAGTNLNGQLGLGYPTAGYNPLYAMPNGSLLNGQFGAAVNGGFNPYAQQQYLAQLQMQQQLAQQQYYQAQYQAQQQQIAYQRQMMVTQQAGQITAQIQQVQQNSQYQLQVLQRNLNALLMSANYGGYGNSALGAGGYGGLGISAGFNLGLGINSGTNYNTIGPGYTGGIGTAFNNGSTLNLNYNNGQSATVPGIGNGVQLGR